MKRDDWSMPTAAELDTPDLTGPRRLGRDLTFVIALMVFPTFAAWIYFDLFSGQRWMLPAYSISKLIQLVAPLVWVLWVLRERIGIRQAPRRGFLLGALSGFAILGLHLLLYYGYFRSSPVLAEAPEQLREKLVGLGGETPAKFLVLAVFLSFIHSLFEEYYWRWFIYGQLRRYLGPGLAVLISSLGFMAHHVVIIDAYVPREYFWSATVFFSISVAIGGAIWAWTYERTGSLYAGWVSHVMADIAIMITGYDLVFVKG